jgi:hypothetical protein
MFVTHGHIISNVWHLETASGRSNGKVLWISSAKQSPSKDWRNEVEIMLSNLQTYSLNDGEEH